MVFPPPLMIPPIQQPHKQTFIILHGRGSSAQKFGPALLTTEFTLPPISGTGTTSPSPKKATVTLQQTFPHARFVFPTATRNRATLYNRAKTNQWFDNWTLDHQDERDELQAPGLKQTVTYLHGLLRDEIEIVCPGPGTGGGARKVILWGLSQGCAAGLVSLLLWRGEAFGGVVGMCGWLPYALRLEGEMMRPTQSESDEPVFDPFERDTGERQEDVDEEEEEEDIFDRSAKGGEESLGNKEQLDHPVRRAVDSLRDEIELELGQSKEQSLGKEEDLMMFQKIPVFLGHGVEDNKVNIALGRGAFSCLQDLGVERVEWKEYDGLGHRYSGQMLSDIVGWIWREPGWERA